MNALFQVVLIISNLQHTIAETCRRRVLSR